MTSISFISGGDKIAGNLFTATNPEGLAFLLIQGWTGHQNTAAAAALAGLGFTSMTYDMRGNGDSEGRLEDLSRADFLADAAIACDFLKAHVAEGTQIGVIGSSFGSYTAALLSARRPVVCLSLRVPANYPDEGFNDPQLAQKGVTCDFTAWRQQKIGPAENQALLALHNFKGPVQIIEAGADEQVAHQVIQNYVDAVGDKQRLSYSVMKDAPHSLVNGKLTEEYLSLLVDWARQFL